METLNSSIPHFRPNDTGVQAKTKKLYILEIVPVRGEGKKKDRQASRTENSFAQFARYWHSDVLP
jgi:hypothetical protein